MFNSLYTARNQTSPGATLCQPIRSAQTATETGAENLQNETSPAEPAGNIGGKLSTLGWFRSSMHFIFVKIYTFFKTDAVYFYITVS